ncbi:helix-turn-helix transcriptional regulator [Variovorax sp. LT1R16]|uniref:helix-turn-helix transcriptional regulator n=1 Tax=Variovorax sp. LT1R16 TaxID=3443728 RepID=UPI003F457852
MKLLKLDNKPSSASAALATGLMKAIGAEDFAAQLLAAVGIGMPASHCTVFSLGSDGRVEAISSASAIGEVATLTALDYIRMGFDKQDSNMVWLSRRMTGRSAKLWIAHQLAEQVANEEYRLVCYGQIGIRERLSLLSLSPDGARVAINLYRNLSFKSFDDGDSAWLQGNAGLISSAVDRHVQLARQTHPAGQMQREVMTRLSGRERQLFSFIMEGLTTKAAAQRMGVSETTALTYRYRVFRRLGVGSLRELVALLGGRTSATPAADR